MCFGYGSTTSGNFGGLSYSNSNYKLYKTVGTIEKGVPELNNRYKTVIPIDKVTGSYFIGVTTAGYKINVHKIWLKK